MFKQLPKRQIALSVLSAFLLASCSSTHQRVVISNRPLSLEQTPNASDLSHDFIVSNSKNTPKQKATTTPVLMTKPGGTALGQTVKASLHANPIGGNLLADEIAGMVLRADDPVAAVVQILAALDDTTETQQSAVGSGLGVAASLIGLADPDQAAQISALVADADPELQMSFNDAIGSATGSIGGPPATFDPPSPIVKNIYDFLPTDRERHAFELFFPQHGLTTYVLLRDTAPSERNEFFLVAFFSVVSAISDFSHETSADLPIDAHYNMFLFPVKSYKRLIETSEYFVTPSFNITNALLNNDFGYDYRWADQTMMHFCASFSQIASTPPCRLGAARRGPLLVVTYRQENDSKNRVLLVDLSDRENVETLQQDISDLISDQTSALDGQQMLGSIRRSSYDKGRLSTRVLDLFITASKIADIATHLPASWFAASTD